MNRNLIISAALGIISTATACTDTLSLDGTGEAAVSMVRSSESPFTFNSSEGSASRSVSSDTVQSFFVTVVAVEFQSAGSLGGDSGWTRLDMDHAVRIDLMSLPEEGTTARIIAEGNVAAGSYRAVRLVISNPTIAFKGDISFGVGSMVEGGVNYSVEMPQGETAIEATALFSVEARSDSEGTRANVNLEFDAASSLAAVALSTTGTVLISPVVR